jgi:hypothetical protein
MRRSYGKLMHMPAYGLYDNYQLVATIRAPNAETALQLFYVHNEKHPELLLEGDEVRRIPNQH